MRFVLWVTVLAIALGTNRAAGATAGGGTGLLGFYHAGKDLAGPPLLTRVDAQIAFAFGGAAPAPGIPAQDWSARWLGQIEPRFSEACTLIARTDDGVRVWLDGVLVIDGWVTHPATDASATFQAEAGHRYELRIDYFQRSGGSTAILDWQSASQPRQHVPTSQLYPLQDLAVAIPASSLVSPLFVEGVRDPRLHLQAASGGRAAATSDLGAARFFADLPLNPFLPTAVRVSGPHAAVARTVAWTPLDLTGRAPQTDTYRIRLHDRLLLRAPAGAVAVRVRIDSGTGPTFPILPGLQLPVPFDRAGTYDILTTDLAGDELGGIRVIVVDISTAEPVACGVGFTRNVDLTVTPSAQNGALTLVTNDDLWLRVAPGDSGPTWQRAVVTARVQGADARVVARLGAGGPILATQRITPFVIETQGTAGLLVDPVTRRGVATVVIRPFVPDERVDFSLFAHRSTFLGGAKAFSINTSAATSGLGEPGFQVRTDADGATRGVFQFTVVMPVGETMYCMDVTGFAGTNRFQAQ